MKFDYIHCVNVLLDAIEDIIGLPDAKVFYSGKSHDLPKYPYMSYSIPNPHHMEQRTADYMYEQFTSTINCNIYDKDTPEFPIEASDTLHFMLRDDYYQNIFNRNGFAVAAVSSNGDSSNDIANVNDIYAQNVQIKIRFTIHHTSMMPNIKKVNFNND